MNYTTATYYFDYEATVIQELVEPFRNLPTQAQITGLYLRIRDGWRYSPFCIGLTQAHYKASNIMAKPEGHCIDKAILYAAALRALNIPARLHLAKVANHIAAERLEQVLGTNELAPHGLVDVYFSNKWVKCSPAFNKELCERYNVDALEFDGTQDSVMQEYNRTQKEFMSYLEDYGAFDDVPLDFIREIFSSHYPQLYAQLKEEGEIRI